MCGVLAATPSVSIQKQFTWKGATWYFTNRYHFNGGTPADASHWHTLTDAITTAEKAIFPSNVTITLATCYAAGSDVPVASKAYSLTGTLTATSTVKAPAFCCGLARWSTTARTSKNHPVYLFNYWHGLVFDNSSDGDTLKGGQHTAMDTYGNSWISGFSDGSITAVRAGPNGATGTGFFISGYTYDHDLT